MTCIPHFFYANRNKVSLLADSGGGELPPFPVGGHTAVVGAGGRPTTAATAPGCALPRPGLGADLRGEDRDRRGDGGWGIQRTILLQIRSRHTSYLMLKLILLILYRVVHVVVESIMLT